MIWYVIYLMGICWDWWRSAFLSLFSRVGGSRSRVHKQRESEAQLFWPTQELSHISWRTTMEQGFDCPLRGTRVAHQFLMLLSCCPTIRFMCEGNVGFCVLSFHPLCVTQGVLGWFMIWVPLSFTDSWAFLAHRLPASGAGLQAWLLAGELVMVAIKREVGLAPCDFL